MLKSHRACVDLDKNCLRIGGQEIPFLAEHELPEKAKQHIRITVEEDDAAESSSQPARSPPVPSRSRFPGSGNTLKPSPNTQQEAQYPEELISALTNLGATRAQAIQLLKDANGNVDVAASLLFN
jgi:DNA damage-inducible protein 1